jgi:hypothetical protein
VLIIQVPVPQRRIENLKWNSRQCKHCSLGRRYLSARQRWSHSGLVHVNLYILAIDQGQIIGSALCIFAVWISGVLNKHWLDHTHLASGFPKGDAWIRGRGPHDHRDGAVSRHPRRHARLTVVEPHSRWVSWKSVRHEVRYVNLSRFRDD